MCFFYLQQYDKEYKTTLKRAGKQADILDFIYFLADEVAWADILDFIFFADEVAWADILDFIYFLADEVAWADILVFFFS